MYLISGLSHQLFGWCSPDGGYSDDPTNILVDDDGGRLCRQLFEGVFLEVAQSKREELNRRELFTVTGSDRRFTVQLLQRKNINFTYFIMKTR